eukprot:899634_1
MAFEEQRNLPAANALYGETYLIESCEATLREYFATFDGTPKEFYPEVESIFDDLYHENFELVFKDGKSTRWQVVKKTHARYAKRGLKIHLIHMKRIGLNRIDVKFRSDNERLSIHVSRVTQLIYTIEDGMIVQSQVVDASLDRYMHARCTSAILKKDPCV